MDSPEEQRLLTIVLLLGFALLVASIATAFGVGVVAHESEVPRTATPSPSPTPTPTTGQVPTPVLPFVATPNRSATPVPTPSPSATPTTPQDRPNTTPPGPVSTPIPGDTTPPDTIIGARPPDPSSSTSATFGFTSTEAGTFQCSFDNAAFTACSSPKTYNGLAEGQHTFRVRARDTAGNLDASPARINWTVDITPPTTSIMLVPPLPAPNTATFEFASSEAGGFQCSLDHAPFSSCTSPKTYNGLAEGPHTFRVRAVDPAGNVDKRPAFHDWVVDTIPPETFLDETPDFQTTSNVAFFSFYSSEAGSTFMCNLDDGPYVPCDSPVEFVVSRGTHTFRVRAQDPGGNVDPKPATYTWIYSPPIVR